MYLLELVASKAFFHTGQRWYEAILGTAEACSIWTPGSFSKELERLQEHQILAPLGVEKMADWCNSMTIVPKPNRTVQLCIDSAELNWALIMPIHRDPRQNDTLPKLTKVCFMAIIDARSPCLAALLYHLKCNKKFIFNHVCMSIWEMQIHLLEWHQQVICSRKKLMKHSKTYQMSLVYQMTFQLVAYDADSREHVRTLRNVMQTCHWENVKLNRNKFISGALR